MIPMAINTTERPNFLFTLLFGWMLWNTAGDAIGSTMEAIKTVLIILVILIIAAVLGYVIWKAI